MCPPGVDQTTRSPQKWHMMVPGVREKYGINFLGDPYLQRGTNGEVNCWAWEKLARPDPTSLKAPNIVPQLTPNPQLSSALVSLPSELIFDILTYLDETSILSLAASCLLCTYRLIPYIDQQILASSAPWAGEPLACLGTYLTTLPPAFERDAFALSSMPKLQTRLEFEATAASSPSTWRYRNQMCLARRYNWAAISEYVGPGQKYWHRQKDIRLGFDADEDAQCISELQRWISVFTAIDNQSMEHSARPKIPVYVLRQVLSPSRFYPSSGPSRLPLAEEHQKIFSRVKKAIEGRRKRKANALDIEVDLDTIPDADKTYNVWYLRNLDTKEYVRLVLHEIEVEVGKEKRTKSKQINGTAATLKASLQSGFKSFKSGRRFRTSIVAAAIHDGSGIIPIEAVLVARTLWPKHTSTQSRHNGSPSAEEQSIPCWAGHKFDIVTKGMHENTKSLELALVQEQVMTSTATADGSAATGRNYPSGLNHVVREATRDSGWRDVTEENVWIVRKSFGAIGME